MSQTSTIEKFKRIEELLTAQTVRPMTFEEAATYLHISKSYLYRLTSRSEITHYKPGGKKIFFNKQDLDNYLLKNRIASNEEVRFEAARFQMPHKANQSIKPNQIKKRKEKLR